MKAVKELKDEVVEFTQEIVRIPSITGNEEEIAKKFLKKLEEIRVDDAFIDGIGNVVGVILGEGKGPNILLNGHLDIVPTGNVKNWLEYEPFGAEIDKEGNIHGRGAADVKGGLSVQLYTLKLLKTLKEKGISLPGNLIFSAVVYEEAAEMFGMEYLCKTTLPDRKLDFDVVFLCEPTNLNVVIGQRGKVEIIVKTNGKTAHSSTPQLGINALEKMMPLLHKIFNEMNNNMGSHHLLGNGSITVTNLICKPGVLSIIPDECEIYIDRRYLPDEKLEDQLSEFNRIFKEIKKNDPRFKATVKVREVVERSYTGYEKKVQKVHPPWMTDEKNIYVNKTLLSLKKIGQNPKIGYWKFGTDGSMSAGLMGIPTIGYSGAEEHYAHTPEELVNIEKMIKSLEGYFAIVCELFNIDINKLLNE